MKPHIFDEDLARGLENQKLHRFHISKELETRGYKGKFHFEDPPTRDYDDILVFMGYRFLLEYKTDEKLCNTDNVVFEIIPVYYGLKCFHSPLHVFSDKAERQLINAYISGGGKVSCHLNGSGNDYIWSYIGYDENKKEAKRHHFFRGRDISSLVLNSYQSKPYAITETIRGDKSWRTVMCVYRPFEWEQLDIGFNGLINMITPKKAQSLIVPHMQPIMIPKKARPMLVTNQAC